MQQQPEYDDAVAVQTISAAAACLKRPEGMAFSPSGDLKAVANSEGASVSLYRRTAGPGSEYADSPCCILQHDDILRFAHGVDFSPDGMLLAAAARESHCLSIYQRPLETGCDFHAFPVCALAGDEYGLCYPADVAFHPSRRLLVAANRDGAWAVAFFRRLPGKEVVFGFVPGKSISRRTLVEHGLAAVHSLTYLPDGNRLALCHARFWKSADQWGQAAISIFDFDMETCRLAENPSLVYMLGDSHIHSICAHPSGRYLAATACDGDTTIYRLEHDAQGIEPVRSIPHRRKDCNEGPKGVAFTREGTHLEICTADDELLVYDFSP